MKGEKLFLVTGGAHGTGLAIIKELAKTILRQGGERSTVLFTSRQENFKAAQIAEKKLMREFDGKVGFEAFRMDLLNRNDIRHAVHHVQKRFGKVDSIIHNAGGYHEPRPPALLDEVGRKVLMQRAHEMVVTNYHGPKLLTESLLRYMDDDGKILFISSHLSDITSTSFYPDMKLPDRRPL